MVELKEEIEGGFKDFDAYNQCVSVHDSVGYRFQNLALLIEDISSIQIKYDPILNKYDPIST